MKKGLKIILGIIIVIVLIIAGGMFYITRGLDEGSKLSIGAVNVSSIGDGTYSGEYNSGRWANEVKVTVQDHRITKIDIVKDVAVPDPEVTKKLIDKVIEEQNSDVDAVSGATVTCKAYLKAIENALNKGGQ